MWKYIIQFDSTVIKYSYVPTIRLDYIFNYDTKLSQFDRENEPRDNFFLLYFDVTRRRKSSDTSLRLMLFNCICVLFKNNYVNHNLCHNFLRMLI